MKGKRTTHFARGMTLIDVLVGSAIMLIVFLAIFGAFKISIELVYSTKAKIGAVSLMTERLEYLRGLPYASVGTVGGIPGGAIPQVEQTSLNGVSYTLRTLVQYVDAPEDGLDDLDENGVTADYKTVKVEVSWMVKDSSRSTFAVTRIAPIGQESLEGGGTLRVNVFNNAVAAVQGASVRIVNGDVNPAVDVTAQTNAGGSVSFPGTPEAAGYEIYVTKVGYTSAQTYGVTAGNPNPDPIHVSVVEAQTTTASFVIDVDSSVKFFTFEAPGPGSLFDTFTGTSGLSDMMQVEVVNGNLVLDEDPETGYPSDGSAFSDSITPSYLASWDEIVFASSMPSGTHALIRLYYYDGANFVLVPDVDLSGNSIGFTESPVDISALGADVYETLQLGAFLATEDASSTPQLLEWELSYSAGPTPLPGVSFDIHGTKTIGTDSGGQSVYKYEDSFTTTQFAEWLIDPIEWDDYTLTLSDDYDIVERCPATIAPDPEEAMEVSVTLGENTLRSLHVIVSDSSGAPLSDAQVGIAGPGSESGQTGACGQVYFGSLGSGVYTVTVSKGGYQSHEEEVGVSGDTEFEIGLLPN